MTTLLLWKLCKTINSLSWSNRIELYFCYLQLKTFCCVLIAYYLESCCNTYMLGFLDSIRNAVLMLLFWWLWIRNSGKPSTLLLLAPQKEGTGPVLCSLLPRSSLVCWLRSHSEWHPIAADLLQQLQPTAGWCHWYKPLHVRCHDLQTEKTLQRTENHCFSVTGCQENHTEQSLRSSYLTPLRGMLL